MAMGRPSAGAVRALMGIGRWPSDDLEYIIWASASSLNTHHLYFYGPYFVGLIVITHHLFHFAPFNSLACP